MIGQKAAVARTIAFSGVRTLYSASAYRDAAVWSLRAFLAVAIFASFAVSRPRGDRLALTLELGRRAAAEHALEIGWLGSLCAHWLERLAGFSGLAAASALAVVVALALVEIRTRPRAGGVLALIAAILVALSFLDLLRVGAGATNWVWAAALLLTFERLRGASLVAAAFGVTVVWCNLAPEGIFAPLLAGLVALGRTIDAGEARGRDIWSAAAVVGAATLCTPAGTEYPLQALWAAHLHATLSEVLPIAPYLVAPQAYHSGFFAILVAGAALGTRRRSEAILLLCAGIVAVLRNGADAPLLGIIAAPMFAETFAGMEPQFTSPPPAHERLCDGLVALVASLAALALPIGLLVQAPRTVAPPSPVAILQRYAADGRAHRIYCSVLEWCDYALGSPNLRPSLDGRVERADGASRATQRAIARVTKGWKDALVRNRLDTVLTQRTGALAALLALSPQWRVVDADADAILFEREAGR